MTIASDKTSSIRCIATPSSTTLPGIRARSSARVCANNRDTTTIWERASERTFYFPTYYAYRGGTLHVARALGATLTPALEWRSYRRRVIMTSANLRAALQTADRGCFAMFTRMLPYACVLAPIPCCCLTPRRIGFASHISVGFPTEAASARATSQASRCLPAQSPPSRIIASIPLSVGGCSERMAVATTGAPSLIVHPRWW